MTNYQPEPPEYVIGSKEYIEGWFRSTDHLLDVDDVDMQINGGTWIPCGYAGAEQAYVFPDGTAGYERLVQTTAKYDFTDVTTGWKRQYIRVNDVIENTQGIRVIS